MATHQITVCDLCESTDGVQTLTVVWGKNLPWEVDMCERCHKNRVADLQQLGRRAKRNNTRPQSRVKKVPESGFTL